MEPDFGRDGLGSDGSDGGSNRTLENEGNASSPSGELDVDEVGSLYNRLLPMFQRGLKRENHRSLHTGRYDGDTQTPREAVMSTVRTLADAAGIDETDRVLDVGCGLGDDAVWIAGERDATVVGVDISEANLSVARENAREHGVSERTRFRCDDFHRLSTVEDDSFDVFWGLEALVHATDRLVVDQAARVLRDGGHVAFGDFFTRSGAITESDRKQFRTMANGIAAGFDRIDDLVSHLEARGFRSVTVRDESEAVTASVTRRRRLARLGHIVNRLQGLLGFGSDTHADYARSYLAICELFDRGTIGYYFVTAER